MIYWWITNDNCIVISEAMASKSKSAYMREYVELKLKHVSESNLLSVRGKFEVDAKWDIHFYRPNTQLILVCITENSVARSQIVKFFDDINDSFMK